MGINESHPAINVPNENIQLWKYMDLPSFFSLLVDSKLCFTRADFMEDKYEGTFPKLTAQQLDEHASHSISRGELNPGYRNLSQVLTQDKTRVYLSCWCQENTEMIHMWKIYSKQSGIAIETSYDDLKKSITDEENVFPTKIRYIDFEKEGLDWKNNGLTVFTVKRIEYKSESEFRLIVSFPRLVEDQLLKYKTHEAQALPRRQLYNKTKVIKISVDIFKLIRAVHISPFAPDWYRDLVVSTLRKFGYEKIEVKVSTL